jgi:hypothetical protein
MQTGLLVTLNYPGKPAKGKDTKPDPNVIDLLKSLKAGDVVDIKGGEVEGRHVLRSIDAFKPKPGEDEPGVFVFRRMVVKELSGIKDIEFSTIEVSKVFQTLTIVIPMVKGDDGKLTPEPKLLAQVRKLKEGASVFISAEVIGQNIVLRTIEPYTAPLKAEFIKYASKKASDDKSFAAVDLKTDAGTETVSIPNVKNADGYAIADRALMAVVTSLKPSQTVEYRLRKDESGSWLTLLRPAQEKTAKTGKVEKPAQ